MLLAAATLTLSGCSFFRSAWFHGGNKAPALASAPVAPAKAPTPLTEAGRAYLAAGNTGLAIEAFQHALGTGEPPAPALNGLGVAYARLDRFETAQRLFQQAIALAPENEQYAANMARLLRSPTLAMRHDGDIAAAAAPELAKAEPVKAPVPGQVMRVSANEFRIVTIQPGAAPTAAKTAPKQALALATVPAKVTPAKRAAASLAPAKPAAEPTTKVIANPFVAGAAAINTPAITVETKSAPAEKTEAAL
jgi:Flp pilus assembly protein TadD